MQEWYLLDHPGLLILSALGMLCGISDARWRASRGALTWAGGILMVCASALLVLRGASLWEGAVLLMAYLLVVMEVRT